MKRYNYYEQVTRDVKDYIVDNYSQDEICELDSCELVDELWEIDSVTGNASGSYFFSTYKAEEAICHNLDLLFDAYKEFGIPKEFRGAEVADITIRCYVLPTCVDRALEELIGELIGENE